ncbi:MAG TPA: ABC transporter permease [Opitutaceae bacterium]|nr:ABC transporter permease [Opitutaceae bacterium]
MWQDLCFSFRLLTRQPGFAFIAILAIGIGIGQATTTFNSFSALVLRPLPHMEDEDNVVYLEQVQAKAPDTRLNLSLPDFLDVRARSQTLDRPTILMSRTLIIGTGDRPIRLYGTSISAEGFSMLGVKPHRGRLFHPDEDAPGAAAVVLLSHRTWRQHYGGREDLVGKAITINGAEVTVVGIMPPGFGFPENSDAWMPFINSEKDYPRGNHSFPVYARLKPGVTLDAAQAELQVISQTLAQQYRETNDGISISVQRLRVATTADIRLLMHLTLGAVLCVLLIACANVANLLLAKAVDRHHEVAIRIALGASRGRIIRQLLTESLVLGLLGGLVGLVLAVWDNALIIGTIPVDLPYWMNFDFDWRVFAFAAAAAIISSLIFGLAPALQITRNIALELKEGGRGGVGSPRAQRLRQLLVIGQVALATLLLIGAGLMVRSYLKIQNADLGFDPRNLLTFRVGLPPTQFTDKAQVRRFFAQLTPALAAIPGVEAAGAASMLPSNGIGLNAFSIEGRPRPPTLGEHPFAVAREITPGYLQTLRIPLLRGRDISVTDTIDQPRVLLVDQAFIDRWFPGEEVLGRRLNFGDHDKPEDWATIVGVVGTVPQRLEANVPGFNVYSAVDQQTNYFLTYAIRVQGDPLSYATAAQRAVISVLPGIPIYTVQTMERSLLMSYWHRKFFGRVFASYGLVALFLASLGIYGVMTYTVSQRTQELGVRMALGAQPQDVLRLVGRQGLWLVGTGLGIGLVAALALTRLMSSFLYGVSPSDPPTYFVLSFVLAAIGLLACWLPARRATRIAPMASLRGS